MAGYYIKQGNESFNAAVLFEEIKGNSIKFFFIQTGVNGYLSLCVSLGADWYSVSHPLTAGIASSPPAILSLIHTYIYFSYRCLISM